MFEMGRRAAIAPLGDRRRLRGERHGAAWRAAAQASVISIGSVLPERFHADRIRPACRRFSTPPARGGSEPRLPGQRRDRPLAGPGRQRRPLLPPGPAPERQRRLRSRGHQPAGNARRRGLQTFSTNLKVQAGDLIGIDPTNDTDEIGVAETSGASYASIFPTPFDGSVVPPSETFSGKEIELSAEVQPAAGSRVDLAAVRLGHRWHPGDDHRQELQQRHGGEVRRHAGGQLHGRLRHRDHRDRPAQHCARAKSTSRHDPRRRQCQHPVRRLRLPACVVPALKNKTLKKAKTLLRRQWLQARPREEGRGAEAEQGRQGPQADPEAGQDPGPRCAGAHQPGRRSQP